MTKPNRQITKTKQTYDKTKQTVENRQTDRMPPQTGGRKHNGQDKHQTEKVLFKRDRKNLPAYKQDNRDGWETFGTGKQRTKENTKTREEKDNRQKKQIINRNKCQADKQQIKDK